MFAYVGGYVFTLQQSRHTTNAWKFVSLDQRPRFSLLYSPSDPTPSTPLTFRPLFSVQTPLQPIFPTPLPLPLSTPTPFKYALKPHHNLHQPLIFQPLHPTNPFRQSSTPIFHISLFSFSPISTSIPPNPNHHSTSTPNPTLQIHIKPLFSHFKLPHTHTLSHSNPTP